MAAPSVSLVHRTSKTRPNGEAPVWIRVTHARRSRFYTGTGVEVKPADWNDVKKKVRGGHALSTAFNATLSDLLNRAQTAALSADSAEAVIAAIDGAGAASLSDFFDRYLERLARGAQVWEGKKYRTLRRKLSDALGWPLTWGALTPDRLDAFAAYMRTEEGNGTNTVRKELERLRRLARLAIREGDLEPGGDPFLRFKMPKSAPVSRRRLSPGDVQRLLALGPADGVADGTRLAATRDLFALQYYGAGVRISDALRLTPENVAGDRLTYTMMKTEHAQSVRLPPAALRVARRLASGVEARDARGRARYGRYLVPLLKPGDDADPVGVRRRIASASTQVNKLLKELARLAGLDPTGLSSHVARHSFADFARQSGDLYAVSKALGHTDLKTTQAYLSSFDRDAVDSLTDSLWTDE
ncbi:tyrosine-type recombinase/integrase [Rubricoccus marinus]|uniref:Tyr recombinase domain-containing protein n=1 Tax=Rubricoccus marinus TaxID=716817 RepID=A0A259U1X2_9BACT|nr:tyrosine-type recombinase/integrase [Rubricoccus marinus]OZC04035.1 hypothetical protein BSZ36_14205 [Rubricoccus marinus]